MMQGLLRVLLPFINNCLVAYFYNYSLYKYEKNFLYGKYCTYIKYVAYSNLLGQIIF